MKIMNISTIKRKVFTVIRDPKSILVKALYFSSPIFNDELYLKLLFPLKTGYRLNLNNPKTYNEKLQWLKLHYRKPIMTQIVDKYDAKDFAKKIIGDKHIVESYGVWDSFDQIDFDSLPDKFVLKTTHDQGGVIVVNNKNDFDKKVAKKKIESHLKFEHYYLTREWPYKNVKPRVMAEALLVNDKVGDLYDYKFYCFHGEPKVMFITEGRQGDTTHQEFYDMKFNKLHIRRSGFTQSSRILQKPKSWELMQELARLLSVGFPHVRVDFYDIDGKVYLGELTFFTGGGMRPFYPHAWDCTFGSWIDIEAVKKEIDWKNINENC